MKYLKYYHNASDIDLSSPCVSRYIMQPRSGPTIHLIHNSDKTESKTYYVGRKLNPLDSPVKYTWRFEYYNNRPAIILNFSKIDLSKVNGDCVICLEYGNMNRHSSSGKDASEFFNKIGPKFNNQVRGHCLPRYESGELITEISNAYYLKDLNLNTDYVLYIETFNNYSHNYSSRDFNHQKYADWECRLLIRPTIRGSFKQTLEFMAANYSSSLSRLYTHNPRIPTESYKMCKFPYVDLQN